MSGNWNLEKALQEPPPAFHPLAGCDLGNLRAHLKQNSGFSPRTRSQRIASIAAVLLRQPFTLVERLAFGRQVGSYELPHPPLFIVGHWRSGTTHLHNLLSTHPGFSTIDFGQTAMPHNLLNPTRVIGRAAVARVIPKDRGMDKVDLGIDQPQEEEMALGNLNPICYYNVFYYPQQMRHHFDRAIFMEHTTEEERAAFDAAYVKLLRKLSIAGGHQPLLLKNPASTARLALLDRLFPGCRFIHIVRNPYEVFTSMLHHYPRLFNAFSWQDFSGIDLEEMVFYKYRRLMQGYLEQRDLVKDRLIETSYEKIVADPESEIARLYGSFDLPGLDLAMDSVRRRMERTRGYQRSRYRMTRAQADRIESEWGFALREWGYRLPDSIEVV